MCDNRMDAKTTMRRQTAESIQRLDRSLREASDQKILEYVRSLREFNEAGMLFCYVGTQAEINTKIIITQALRLGKQVCVPRCIRRGVMQAVAIESLGDLAEGRYGIEEPKAHCQLVDSGEIQFGLIPCVTCNTLGYRLGYGGGFYDRYLEHASFPTAVLCRAALLQDEIPREPHDVQIPIVVTDMGIYRNGELMRK